MEPRAKDYLRVLRRIEAALAEPAAAPDGVVRDFLTTTWDLLGVSSSCWHHTDPRSGLPISSSVAGDPPGSLEWSLEFEYARPDVSRFADLRRRPVPVAAISAETGGAPASSARFREMIAPTGAADELRIAFRDAFGLWATVVVFTTRRMTPDDLRLVSAVLPAGAAALRTATVRAAGQTPEAQSRPPDPGGPSVVILDPSDAILAADAVSRARLESFPEQRDVSLPGIVSVLAAQARCASVAERATARMRTPDGRWFELDASPLDDSPGSVAVVIQPAPLASVRDALLSALGLSPRERQVALLSLQGQSAKEIARDLRISRWTVHDHLKSVYAKTGTNSRADLGALGGPMVAGAASGRVAPQPGA